METQAEEEAMKTEREWALQLALEKIAYPVNWPELEAMPGYEAKRAAWMQAVAANALSGDD